MLVDLVDSEKQMTIEEIRKNVPSGATHYYVIMFLGIIYIKYIENHPYYLHNTVNTWTKCNSYFEEKPLY